MVATFPNRKVSVNGSDISQDSITTMVELRESGISMVTLIANNDDGKNYLTTLHTNDEVIVKMLADNGDPITTINWNIIDAIFIGNIQELSPILAVSGEVCQVIAYGKGYQFKEMRVSKRYGYITPITSWGYVNHFDATIHEWDSSTGYHRGSIPYIHHYSGLPFPLGYAFLYICNEIHSELSGHLGDMIGAFSLGISPEYDGGEFLTAELHIVGALYSNGAGTADDINIRPYWTIDDGAHWTVFDAGEFPSIDAVINSEGVNNPVWETYPLIGNKSNRNYNPPVDGDDIDDPPVGNNVFIDIKPNFPYWNKNLKIKLEISQVGGTVQGGVTITLMYLKYQFNPTSGKTCRELLVGEAGNQGIIPLFVNKILGTEDVSGYDDILTDYIVKDDNEDLYKIIPYINFPYMDSLIAIQDIIKYISALRFLDGDVGYHWMVDPDSNLLVAPVNNHTVEGIDDEHIVSDKWVLKPYDTPIKVKADILSQSLKEEPPIANYVLVAGNYRFPLNDNICSGDTNIFYSLDRWRFTSGTGDFGAVDVVREYDDQSNTPCLELQCKYNVDITGLSKVRNIYAYPMFQDKFYNPVDITQLMGFNTVPPLSFWLRVGGGVSDVQVRLYVEDPDLENYPLLNTFFAVNIGNLTAPQDMWGFIKVDLPNTKYLKEYGDWRIDTDDILGLSPKALDWLDMNRVKFFSIHYFAVNATEGQTPPYVRLRGLSLNGTVIRAAYDSNNITTYGCRTLTIKDSMNITDNLNVDEDKNALALEAIYDLQRYRKLRITGEISIPLDPTWKGGQQIWLQAEDTIPIGVTVKSGASDPTTGTVGNLGDYYVNTSSWETFICTNGPPAPYAWTTTGEVRYRINKWFRVTKVSHIFNDTGAVTKLTVTDDITSSIPVDTSDVYTVIMRMFSPDFQSRTLGSLKSSADYDLGLNILAKDYSAYTQ